MWEYAHLQLPDGNAHALLLAVAYMVLKNHNSGFKLYKRRFCAASHWRKTSGMQM